MQSTKKFVNGFLVNLVVLALSHDRSLRNSWRDRRYSTSTKKNKKEKNSKKISNEKKNQIICTAQWLAQVVGARGYLGQVFKWGIKWECRFGLKVFYIVREGEIKEKQTKKE